MSEQDFFSKQVFRTRIFRRNSSGTTTRGKEVTVVCGGCEHCSADYRIDRLGFPFVCLEFVVAGRGKVSVAGGEWQALEPGSVFTYAPSTRYRMESDTARPFVKYFVDFTGRRAPALLREAGLIPGTVAQVFPPESIADAFDRLIDVGQEETAQASRRTALLLEALLLQCSDQRVPDGASESRAFATYRHCRDVIDALDPSGPVICSVAATARVCHVDSAYLCRLFRRFAQVAPYRYLTKRRMDAATARLSQPGCLVKVAAMEFGFADAYHFSRAFKNIHGISPMKFLKGRKGLDHELEPDKASGLSRKGKL